MTPPFCHCEAQSAEAISLLIVPRLVGADRGRGISAGYGSHEKASQ